jgi:hypothetical protein
MKHHWDWDLSDPLRYVARSSVRSPRLAPISSDTSASINSCTSHRSDSRTPETFEFLGFTHICAKSRSGRFMLKRVSSKKRMAARLSEVNAELMRRRHLPIPEQGRWLASVVRGHCNYYGQIVAVETTFGAQMNAMNVDRQVLGPTHRGSEVSARMDRHSKMRVSAALADPDAAGAGVALILSAADIAEARLSKGLFLCKLRVRVKCARAARSASSSAGSPAIASMTPNNRRVRGDLPEQRLLVAHRAQVGQAVAAVREHHRQIAHHPPRVVLAAPFAHRRQRARELPRQPKAVGRLRQPCRAGVRDQTLSVRSDFYGETAPIALHPQGDPPEPLCRPLTTRRIPAHADSSAAPTTGAMTA